MVFKAKGKTWTEIKDAGSGNDASLTENQGEEEERLGSVSSGRAILASRPNSKNFECRRH
jgi:hypothetical protein